MGKANTGLSYLERSLASNSNSGIFRYAYAAALSCISQTEDALTQFDMFFRQSPKDPNMGVACFYKCLALSILGRYLEAQQAASLGIKHQPTFPWLCVVHAGALSGLERHEEAQRAMDQARQMAPHFTLAKITAFWRFLFTNPDDAEKLNHLMRMAWQES